MTKMAGKPFPNFLQDASAYWSSSSLIQPSVSDHNDLATVSLDTTALSRRHPLHYVASWPAPPVTEKCPQSAVIPSLQNVYGECE